MNEVDTRVKVIKSKYEFEEELKKLPVTIIMDSGDELYSSSISIIEEYDDLKQFIQKKITQAYEKGYKEGLKKE